MRNYNWIFSRYRKAGKKTKKLVKKLDQFSHNEFKLVKNHPELGVKAILALINHMNGEYFPTNMNFSSNIYLTTFSHHVRPDNDSERSYPKFIPPSELTPIVKLTTLTDSFDSMTTRRFDYEQNPDVKRHDIDGCFTEIKGQKGKQFDPKLTEIFLKLRVHPEII